MNIEELDKAEKAAWKRYQTVIATHQPIIDKAISDWSSASMAVTKEKQLAAWRAEIEAENAE